MITFSTLLPEHWGDVKAIYEEGVKTGNATFELSTPGWEQWNSSHVEHSRIVALADGEVAGWAALTPVQGDVYMPG